MTKRTPPMLWSAPSDRFLAYLDRLAAAAVSRDRGEMDKLMRMRMSSHLPQAVLDELEYFRRARDENLRAPLKLMRFVHQMRQLASAPPADRPQLGLDLRERTVEPAMRGGGRGSRDRGRGIPSAGSAPADETGE
jgi:hypothetical protein